MGAVDLTEERRQQLIADFARSLQVDPQIFMQAMIGALGRCGESDKRRIRDLLGCGCGGNGHIDDKWITERLRLLACCDPNQRLSWAEQEMLRASDGAVVDLPDVAGAGATATVDVPAYGVSWYFRQFSVDGRVPATASLAKVNIEILHASRQIANFRVSQYYKENCCTTIADEFRRFKRCFGYGSTFQIKITNANTNAGDTFTQGVFSYVRGYPKDFDDLQIFDAATKC